MPFSCLFPTPTFWLDAEKVPFLRIWRCVSIRDVHLLVPLLGLHLSVSSLTVWQRGLDLLFSQTSLQPIAEVLSILRVLTFRNNSSLSHSKIRSLPPSRCSPSSVTNHPCFVPDFWSRSWFPSFCTLSHFNVYVSCDPLLHVNHPNQDSV